jgi:hypothetical protein
LKNLQYAYIAPTYRQAKRIAWQYFKDYTRNIPNAEPKETELSIYIERPDRVCPVTGFPDPDVIKIMLVGADDPDDIRGIYLDGACIDEYAKCDPIVWRQIVRPALADRKKIARDLGLYEDMRGMALTPWAVLCGTPKGQNHLFRIKKDAEESMAQVKDYEATTDVVKEAAYWRVIEAQENINEDTPEVELNQKMTKWPESQRARFDKWVGYRVALNWSYFEFKGSETGVLGLEEMREMRSELTPEEYEQEVECSFTAAILGSYYGHLLNHARTEGRIGKVPLDPRYPVGTRWDIGIGDKTAIWFQQKIGGTYRYVYYYENNGKGLDYYESVLRALAKPIGHETILEDGSKILGRGFRYGRHVWPHDGAAKEFGTGQTRQETARKMGLYVEIQTRYSPEDGINAARARIKSSMFDEEGCARGLECLYNYQRLYDEKLMMFKETPLHDWSSHGADAFRTSAMDDREDKFQDALSGTSSAKFNVKKSYRVLS